MFASTQIFGLAAMALSSVFSANAAPIPASAPALVEKDVGVLACKGVHTGPLQWSSNKGSGHGYVSFVGPKTDDGLPILHTTRASGEGVPAHEFHFLNCTSDKTPSFMNYNTHGGKIAIGHISPVGQPGKCISAAALGKGSNSPQQFVLDDCSNSDDSSQLFQTFSLAENAISAHFFGHQAGEKGPYYHLSVEDAKYGNVLVTESDSATGGAIGLRFYNEISSQ